MSSLSQLEQELQAAYTQLGYTLDEADRVRIKRRIEALEQEISELRSLSNPTRPRPGNPFGDRGQLPPERFFDREELLRQIFQELSKGQSLSLVGEREIGKSSLLAMVRHLGQQRICPAPDAIIYLSLQIAHDEGDFFDALCNELHIETCRGNKLYRALRGRRYVVCLDEAEVMKSESFSLNTRRELRGLADGSAMPLRLVIASRLPLARLFPDSPEDDSPLANLCLQLDVKPFSPDESRAFVLQEPPARHRR